MNDFARMNTDQKIYLASKSPRRQELLKLMGFNFELLLKEVDESYPKELSPVNVAKFIAEKKINAFDEVKDGLVITADTIVVTKDEILGKPVDADDAFRILKKLNQASHEVITGVALKKGTKKLVFAETTTVYFKKLENEQINFYIKNYKPFDKAGAYGIQEWIGLIGISKIDGSYTNVMGLPTEKLYEELLRF